MNLLDVIPLPYRILALLVFAVALMGFGWVEGARHVQTRWNAEKDATVVLTKTVQVHDLQNQIQVVTRYVDKVRVVHDQVQPLIQEIPHEIPTDTPALPGGFRLLHDAATGASEPTASGADAAPVPVTDATSTILANYESCRKNAEQVIALQNYLKSQQALCTTQ